ncbi:MAG: glycosyltransferase family 2 protein [Acidimicrobiaceae bacterium]|nr:glycosyltransferase family 2 protein [Acidimicrobiaceae bacterium]
MSGTDLTVIVTAHDETVVCGPTMRSADIAVDFARAAGFSVQTVVALDNATEATTEYFHQQAFSQWEKWPTHEGDPGRARNTVMPRTAGRWIALLDADDLFSENWLADGLGVLSAAEERGERVIAHPEVNLMFDGGIALNHNIGQDSPLFTPYFLYARNCYDTLCLSPRQAHLDVPYGGRDIANGLSREDWQYGIETMARGWKHVVVPDTIIFKRRREFGMMTESSSNKALVRSLPEMAIDRVRDLAGARDA